MFAIVMVKFPLPGQFINFAFHSGFFIVRGYLKCHLVLHKDDVNSCTLVDAEVILKV